MRSRWEITRGSIRPWLAAAAFLSLSACDSSTEPTGGGDAFPPGPSQFALQAAFDGSHVAIRATWVSRPKVFPEGFANVGRVYPGQYHDLLVHDGTRFDRLPSAGRIQEDRANFMIAERDEGGAIFATSGCYAACHSGMDSHKTINNSTLDLWHWRGGRSGPMGYAEDTGISPGGRIRDGLGMPPSAFLRSAGDRFRENQGALSNTGHPLVEGFPRFVFQRGKALPGADPISSFFLTGPSGDLLLDPYSDIAAITDVSQNRSLLVVYQDRAFDPVDQVNAIDVGYLVHVANGATAHLPSHLRAPGDGRFETWRSFWAQELGIQPTNAQAAQSLLEEIHAEWETSGGAAMVTRSVGFIYESSQHDLRTTRQFDAVNGEWSVTFIRELDTGDPQDVNLTALESGAVFPFGFAVHDQGEGSESHDISLPYVLGSGANADLRAVRVPNAQEVDWNAVPSLEGRFISREFLQMGAPWTLDDLENPSIHQGWEFVRVIQCQACHGVDVIRIDN